MGDTENHRVDEFSAAGEFILAFGKGVDLKTGGDVCTAASEDPCGKGAEGSTPGELSAPTFVAVDNSCALHEPVLSGPECEALDPSDGDVYVADAADDRVSKFTSAGVLVSSWGAGGQMYETPVLAEGTGDVTVGSSEITNVSTTLGRFEAFQTLTGEGVPAGSKIGHVGGGTLTLSEGEQATKTASGVALSARFVLRELGGIAVDAQGDLWVYNADGNGGAHMLEFAADGTFTQAWESPVGLTPAGIAVAPASGDLYVSADAAVWELSQAGAAIGEVERAAGNGGVVTGLGVGPGSGGLFVDSGPTEFPGVEVRVFPGSCEAEDPSCVVCEPAKALCTAEEGFGGSGEKEGDRLSEGQGIAVGPGEHVVVADAGADQVLVFKQVQLPNVVTGEARGLTDTGAVLAGTVNPAGVQVSECLFEYGPTEEYGQTTPCEQDAGQIGSGKGPVEVTAKVSLSPGFYHFRLVAGNTNGVVRGADGAVGASVDAGAVVSAGESTAVLAGQINPHGHQTACTVQYVSEAQFAADGFSGAEPMPCSTREVGSGSVDVPVGAELAGLLPGTAYHFHFLATVSGALGERTTVGEEGVLATYPTLAFRGCGNEALREEDVSLKLPDCRAYERVSSNDNSEVYAPLLPRAAEDGMTSAEAPTQSSPRGDAVVYVGESASSGEGEGTGDVGGGEGDEHIATRGEGGWSSRDIEPGGAGSTTIYEMFSTDLTSGILRTGIASEPLGAGLSHNCLYARETGGPEAYAPLLAGKGCGKPFVVGSAENGPGVVFESQAAAVAGAVEPPPKLDEKGEPILDDEGEPEIKEAGHENVYDYGEGLLRLVNVLPGVSPPPEPEATAGSLSNEPELDLLGVNIPAVSVSNVVSDDGSHVFWTDLATGVVYVRVNPLAVPSRISNGKCTVPVDACTLQVSQHAATYWTASADGRYSYYVENGGLWRFDTETGERIEVAPAGAGVQGVVGVNQTGEDGAFVYFVAEGALASGAQTRKCHAANPAGGGNEPTEARQEQEGFAPMGRGCNLYVTHGGTTTLIATLLAGDDEFVGTALTYPQPKRGDWSRVLGDRSAQLTPDGEALVFTSERQLTSGYENVNRTNECGTETEIHACAEVYEYKYEGGMGQLVCVSCTPSGVAPQGAYDERSTRLFLPFDNTSVVHTTRVVSSDGTRVFFDAAMPLTPGAGAHMGVFEWEQEDAQARGVTGGCEKGSPFNGGGCLYLIAGGQTGPAYLSEIDETGDNAFFVTRAGRVPGVVGEVPGLFDARVEGGFPEEAEPPPPCVEAQSCRPSPPPLGLGSVDSGMGPGNFPEGTIIRKESPPALTAKQKLTEGLTACRRDRKKRARVSCERRAYARYDRETHKKAAGSKSSHDKSAGRRKKTRRTHSGRGR